MRDLAILLCIIFIACNGKRPHDSYTYQGVSEVTDDYELVKSVEDRALLILFPGGGSTAKETKEEFAIIDKAVKRGISILLMNFTNHLWIEDNDSNYLSKLIAQAIKENNLNTSNIYIGGMSIGGTVSLSLSNYLVKTKSELNPKGIFIVDSPIDLFSLYQSSKNDLLRKDFTEDRLAEPKWIVDHLENQFGIRDSLFKEIEKVAPITLESKNHLNIKYLINKKLRLYTEPDSLWWKQNRQTEFKNTNAFVIQRTYDLLSSENWDKVELIQTKNRGYRSNGNRHPHSWSIVEVDGLINWILN